MKRVFLVGVIAYSVALLILQDWPSMAATTGAASAPFLGLMIVDAAFALIAAYKMVGFAGFGIDEDDDEVSVHAEDVEVPDTWFYGIFALDLLGHCGWHAYEAIMAQGAYSFYSSIWFMAELAALALTWIFFRHAVAKAHREARRNKPAPRAVA